MVVGEVVRTSLKLVIEQIIMLISQRVKPYQKIEQTKEKKNTTITYEQVRLYKFAHGVSLI